MWAAICGHSPDIDSNAIDNIVFSTTPGITVPEPTGLGLAGLALGVLAVSTRRRSADR